MRASNRIGDYSFPIGWRESRLSFLFYGPVKRPAFRRTSGHGRRLSFLLPAYSDYGPRSKRLWP